MYGYKLYTIKGKLRFTPMKAIEVQGTVNELGQLSLDEPLTIAKQSRKIQTKFTQ
ncbi:hypothetical protein NSMS1_23550 [Nostoc sp. MS1]|nr:hypothetical protein NSMS1_23550 [Nostoc sp. MS1]